MVIEGVPHPQPHAPNSPALGRDFPELGRACSTALRHRKEAFKLEGLNLTTKKQGTVGSLPRTGRSVSTIADIPPHTLLAGGEQGELHCLRSPETLTVQTRAGWSEHTSSWPPPTPKHTHQRPSSPTKEVLSLTLTQIHAACSPSIPSCPACTARACANPGDFCTVPIHPQAPHYHGPRWLPPRRPSDGAPWSPVALPEKAQPTAHLGVP